MAHRFDEIAKALAEGVSRREALRRLGGAFSAALLASLALKPARGQGAGGRGCNPRSLARCLDMATTLCARQHNRCLRWAGTDATRQALCHEQSERCNQAGMADCQGRFGCPSGQTCQNGRCVPECIPACDFDRMCVNGACECPPNLEPCGAGCYDPTSAVCCVSGSYWSWCRQPALCCPAPDTPEFVVCTEGTVCP